MVARDCKPGSPPDGTVCADRRSCDHLGPAAAWAAEEAHRRRAGVPGRGAGAARCPVGASLAADVLRPARAPVPLPAEPARLSQAAQGGRAAAGRGDGLPGPRGAVVARPGAADRRHPGAVRELAGDGPPVRAGRVGRLRLLRGACALVLGPEAVPGHHPGRDAGGLVPGQPEDRRARSRCRTPGPCRPHRRTAAGTDPDRGTRASPGATSRTWSPPATGCTWSAPTAATSRPATGRSAGSASGSSPSTTPSKASSTSNATAAAPPKASTPASPKGCSPWQQLSGTTGPPPNPSSDR